MLLTLARWVQSTGISAALAGSTWAYPVIGGLHVLGIAWFGGAVLLSALGKRSGKAGAGLAMLWTSGAFMVVTGGLLFAIEPLRCAMSEAFRVKMLLLVTLALTIRVRSRIGIALDLALWAAVLLAARGIAYF